MPALITHRLFGEESIDRLPEGLVCSEDERCAFLLANQGPDPFFFHVRTPNISASTELAQRMHRSRMTRQLDALREGVAHMRKHDARVARAFTLGLLSHYILDRNAHPFVYAQQWGIQKADPDLADAGSEVHAIIESDLDVMMLKLKRDGATVEDFPPVCELVTTKRIDKVAGALMSFVAHRVYGIEIGANEYGGAVADMQLVYRLIEPAGSPNMRAISTLERLVRKNSMLGSLAHPVTDDLPAAGNLTHRPWRDPFSGKESHASFPEVFDHALDDYERAAILFIESEGADAVTEHINYSGRPLTADEEFDREE